MQVGSLVRYKTSGWIGFVLETNCDRALVHFPNHRNPVWWLDQILVEVLCK